MTSMTSEASLDVRIANNHHVRGGDPRPTSLRLCPSRSPLRGKGGQTPG